MEKDKKVKCVDCVHCNLENKECTLRLCNLSDNMLYEKDYCSLFSYKKEVKKDGE